MMEMSREPEGDILFVRFSKEPVAKTVMRSPDILLDLDAAGLPVTLEIVGMAQTPVEAMVAVFDEFGIKIAHPELIGR